MTSDPFGDLQAALLRSLEQRAGHVLPVTFREQLAAKLTDALRDQMRREADGSLVAPNVFYILVHPGRARIVNNVPDIRDWLAAVLQEGINRLPARLLTPPVIHIFGDPTLTDRMVHVQAQISLESAAEVLFLKKTVSEETVPANAFLIVQGRQVFHLTRPVTNIGRRLDNHLVLDDPRVSRSHAQIRVDKGRFLLHDLHSTGGTFVNGKRIRDPVALRPGDVISLAGVTLVFGQEVPSTDEEEYTRPFPPRPAGDEKTRLLRADDDQEP